jgi:hypothetical protein
MNLKYLAAAVLISIPVQGVAQDRCQLPEVDDHRFLSALYTRLISCNENYVTRRVNKRNGNGMYKVKTEVLFKVDGLRYAVTLDSRGRDVEIVIRSRIRRVLGFKLGDHNAKTCDNVKYMEIYKEGVHKLPEEFKHSSYTFDIDGSKGEPKLEKESIEAPFKYTNATFDTYAPMTDNSDAGKFVGRLCRGLLGAAREKINSVGIL